MLDKEPVWITDTILYDAHQKIISQHGGIHGVRDKTLLESAIAQPKNLYYYSGVNLLRLSLLYMESIMKNHAFLDGNKRISIFAFHYFLKLNNVELDEAIWKSNQFKIFLEFAQGKLDRKHLINMSREWIQEKKF